MTRRAALTDVEAAFVEEQRVAHLATADKDGNPHVIPVCYAFDGVHFYTPLDEKPKRVAGSELRRVRNIEVRPEVSLVIDRYDENWSRLGYVLIHGRAEMLQPGDENHSRALALLRARYAQYRAMALERHLVIRITPAAVTSWGPALSANRVVQPE